MPIDNDLGTQQWRDVQAARRGDGEALGRLYDDLLPRLYAYVAHRIATRQDAEDIVAETWLRAVRELQQFRGQGFSAFSGWLFQIARNLIADHYRRSSPTEPVPNGELDRQATGLPLPAQMVEQDERRQHVQAAIRALSPRRQEVVVLRYFAGLRNQEIAQLLGLDERTVASHLSRALQDLHERLLKER